MKRSQRSLRTQLILWNIVSLAVLLGGFGVAVRYTVSTALMRSVDRALERHIVQLPGGGPNAPDHRDPTSSENEPPEPPPQEQFQGQWQGNTPSDEDISLTPRHFDLAGNPLGFRTMLSRESFDVAAQQGVRDTRRIFIQDEPIQVLSVPLFQQGTLHGVGQVGYRLTEIDDAIATLDRTLLFLLPLGLLCAALGGILLTNRVLRRIHSIARAATAITTQDTSDSERHATRLPVQGNDEFAELATVLNNLLDQQEVAFLEQQRALDQERRFTGDASHELKSPLTVIKGLTSMAVANHATLSHEQYRHYLSQVEVATDGVIQLVQDLLLLARSDSRQLGQEKIEVLLSELLERSLRLYVPIGAPVTIALADPSLVAWGNESELIRLFTNLLSNARQHTPPDGAITVSATSDGDRLIVRITDTGIGIAPEHLPRLGERFYRVDSSRTRERGGTGLGLSICDGIVAAHHGTLAFESQLGVGTTVTLTLPQKSS